MILLPTAGGNEGSKGIENVGEVATMVVPRQCQWISKTLGRGSIAPCASFRFLQILL